MTLACRRQSCKRWQLQAAGMPVQCCSVGSQRSRRLPLRPLHANAITRLHGSGAGSDVRTRQTTHSHNPPSLAATAITCGGSLSIAHRAVIRLHASQQRWADLSGPAAGRGRAVCGVPRAKGGVVPGVSSRCCSAAGGRALPCLWHSGRSVCPPLPEACPPPPPLAHLKERGCAPPLLQSWAATPQPAHSVSASLPSTANSVGK